MSSENSEDKEDSKSSGTKPVKTIKDKLKSLNELLLDKYIEKLESPMSMDIKDMASIVSFLKNNGIVEKSTGSGMHSAVKGVKKEL